MEKEIALFDDHVKARGLKYSNKRTQILRGFLSSKDHVSTEDLFRLVKRENPSIGFTTVYRALKLIVDSGIAEVVDFDDGVKRFERKLGREYHAHLICTKCGRHFEVFNSAIKALNFKLAKQKGFLPQKHRFEVFGLCQQCS